MPVETAQKKWAIVFDKEAEKAGRKLDKTVKKRIVNFLENRLAVRENPRELGKQLMGEFSEYWRYRVGDYRILCKIADETITIIVVKIGHRRDVYV